MADVATPTQTQAPVPALDAEGLDRGVGFFGLLWSSEGSIIGSGWLLGALGAAAIAGPSAIIGWVVASVIVILLALVHAELGGIFPVSGGTSRFPHYAFGSFAGATFGWFAYIQAATVAPIEVEAVIQYLSTAHWARNFYSSSGTIHGAGIVIAFALMVFFVFVNLIGVRWLERVNNALTWLKVLIPVATIIFLLFHLHGSNFSSGGGFFVKGAQVKDVLIAIPTGGIVFSLLGFEQAVQLGGEGAGLERLAGGLQRPDERAVEVGRHHQQIPVGLVDDRALAQGEAAGVRGQQLALVGGDEDGRAPLRLLGQEAGDEPG